ncbi:MAG: tetratricopeptide repeat protein, partial [Bdellovibrionales bacterium]
IDKFVKDSITKNLKDGGGAGAPPPPVIDLKFQDPEIPQKNFRKVLFLLLISISTVFLAILFILPAEKKSDRIRLLKVQPNRPAISEQLAKDKFNLALINIEQSSVESLLKAQNNLVSLIEGQPNNLDARGLLCFVYKELWNFSYQDPEDLKTVEQLVQQTRGLNLTNANGLLCESIRLLVTGRFPQGRAQIDSLLENYGSFSLLPVGYYLKGEVLEIDRELVNAAAYYSKISEMWPGWGRPSLSLANLYFRERKYQEAFQVLENVPKPILQSKERIVLIGLVEARGFQRKDIALRMLDAALNQPGQLLPKLASEAWYTLAELWLDKNEKAKALQAAQKAYRLMPQNKLARELVVRLGGNEEIGGESEQNQSMTLLGDQYFRQGDCLSAQAEYKAAFEMNPKNAEAAMKAGKCLWQLNQTYDALDWLNKAIRANPKLITAYVLQADYLSQRYDFPAAFSLLTRAQQISSQNFEILRGLAWLELRKNNMVGAIQFGERARNLFDGDVETYVLLSRAYRQRATTILPETQKLAKEKEEALKNMRSYATRAVELDATNTEAQLVYAEMLAAQHGVDTGVQYFN